MRFVLLTWALCGTACQGASWRTHTDPAGFSVEVPAGWQAGPDGDSGRVLVTGPARERIVFWPVFAGYPVNPASARTMIQRLVAASGTNATWEAPQAVGPRAVRMIGRSPDRVSIAALTWMPSAKGTAGFLYVITAPPAGYQAGSDTLTRVAASFRAVRAAGAAAAKSAIPGVTWVKWQDPRENAFTIEVPAGWTTKGGLFRMAPVDVRLAWETVSPDGQFRIFGGDADLPTFTEPNQMLAMTGFPEGSWYSPGYGVRQFVRRYLPGVHFVREYVGSRAGRLCTGLNITDNRERRDFDTAANEINRKFAASGVGREMASGEVSFTCTQQGHAMAGYLFASTTLTRVAGTPIGLWNVENMYGYLAPQERAQEAQSLVRHIVETGQPNPQWMAMQQGVTANTSRIVSQTQSEVSKIISDTYWNRQKTADEISRKRSNATLGVEDVVEPASGRQFKVESGANHYWLDNAGNIAGTQTDTRPNLDFRELLRLP